ncbi:MAG: glycosyltransferase family 4 protein [Nitrospirae bacterium]|nr:glycosyltransferase family 4 protein [Nitrospirota bacterium]
MQHGYQDAAAMTNVLYLRQASDGGGGADTVIFNTLAAMKDSKFNIIPVYLRKHHESISTISARLSELGVRNFYEVPGKLPIDPIQLTRIAWIIKSHNVEIIHCHEYKSDILGFLLRRMFPRVKLLSTVHGWIETRARSKYYVKADREVLKRFDAVIVVSLDIMHTCQDKGIKRLHLLQNCVDTHRWSADKYKERADTATSFKVGFVGRLSSEKGPFDFVYAASKVLAEYSDTEFYVAGTGTELHRMKTLAIESGVINRFHFLGHLEEQQVKDLYQQLDVVMLTSYTEGIPLTVLEACAMGVAVVATDVGGVSEVIKHGFSGLLAKAGDVQTLARHVISLRRNRNLMDSLKDNGMDLVQKQFSLQNYTTNLENIYEGILNRR